MMPTDDPLEDVYKYFEPSPAPIGPGSYLCRHPLRGTAFVATAQELGTARRCRSFESIRRHVGNLTASPIGPVRTLASSGPVLRRALDQGLLLSWTDVCDTILESLPSTAANRNITATVIPTRNRPEALSRLLTGLARQLKCKDRRLEVLVIDDSTSADFQDATRAALMPFLSTSGLTFRYCNREGRLAFAQRLSNHTGVPLDIVSFALGGGTDVTTTPGACRNAALLDCCGSTLLFIDDDVECFFTSPSGTDLCIGHSPNSRLTLVRDEDSLAGYNLAPADPLFDLERLLNVTASSVSETALGGRLDLCGMSTPLLERLATYPASVRLAAFGLIGDLAIDSPVPYYTSPLVGPPQTYSEDEWRAICERRLGVRGVSKWTITGRADFPAHCFCVDCHELLPPFLPILRGEEVVFGALIEGCLPEVLVGHVPRAVLHRPVPPRHLAVSVPTMPFVRVPASVVLARLITSISFEADSPAGRMGACGALLIRLGQVGPRQLEQRVLGCVRDALVAMLRSLAASESAGGPDHWIRDIRHLRKVCLSSLNETKPVSLSDLPVLDGPGHTFRALAARMGALVQAWPALWAGALDLRSRGLRCTVPVRDASDCLSQD